MWIIAWWIVGVIGFIYYFGKEMDELFDAGKASGGLLAIVTIFMGFAGVFIWILGYHSRKK